MQDDAEDEYFLGDGGDDGDGDGPGTRRGALLGLAVVVVLVAVTITLTAVFVDTSAAGRGPRTTARRWGEALVHGDTTARRRVECPQGPASADVPALVVSGATGVSVGDPQRIGTDRWAVPVDIDGPDGSPQDSVSVTVVRTAGRYRVC